MIVLTETTDKIQVVLGAAVTANQLPVVSCWRDITTTTYTPGRTLGTTNGASDVDAVGSPAASTQRVVDMLLVRNADTAEATITVKIDANGTEYVLWTETLQPGDSLHYADGLGFSVQRTYQTVKIIPVVDGGANFVMTNATLAERFAGGSTRHLFVTDLTGYTQVRLLVNKMVGSASAGGPTFRARYYTEYNVTVGNFLQLGSAAQVEVSMVAAGYADTGWMALAAGARINGVCIGFTELGGDGVIDPALGLTHLMFR